MRRSAIAGIVLGSNERVLRNVVEDSCLFAEDCGILNSWSRDGKGTEIAYNILRRNRARWGAAIYLDAGSRNFNLHDNLAESILWSGANITGVNTIANNTFVDVQHVGINYVPGSDAVGADWSAGVAAHNRLGEPFPLSVNLYQPVSMVPNWDWYFAYTTLAPGPRRVEIDWSDMAQGVWSQQQVPLNLSEVDAIAFQLDPIATPYSYTVRRPALWRDGLPGSHASRGSDGFPRLPRTGVRSGRHRLAHLGFPGLSGHGQWPSCGGGPRRQSARRRGCGPGRRLAAVRVHRSRDSTRRSGQRGIVPTCAGAGMPR